MGKVFGLRLKEDGVSYLDMLANRYGIKKTRVIALLVDLAESSFLLEDIDGHYREVKDELFKHGNKKEAG